MEKRNQGKADLKSELYDKDESEDHYLEKLEQKVTVKTTSLNDEDEFKYWDYEVEINDFIKGVIEECVKEEKENNNEKIDGVVVTEKLIDNVSKQLCQKSVTSIRDAQQLLTAAILHIQESEDFQLKSRYLVEGSQNVNKVLTMCYTYVAPCLLKILGTSDKPRTSSKWKKLESLITRYLYGLTTLTKMVTKTTQLKLLLRQGILPLLPMFNPILIKILFKNLVYLWSTNKEKVRVETVIIMFKLLKGFDDELYDKALKTLYLSYVKNCRFTSPLTLASINFMRVSLVELYSHDLNIVYSHAFVFIKQLALLLRNAIADETPEQIRKIANWQYLRSLQFWAELLGVSSGSTVTAPLIHPLVQICVGSMNLLKISRYYPFIFHVCNILTELCRSTQVYVPVPDHLQQILEDRRLFVRGTKGSKVIDWSCTIKLKRSQMLESSFNDGLIEQIYNCLVNFVATQSHYISFPEIVFLLSSKLELYIGKCKVSSYSKKMGQLLDVLEENAAYIDSRRKVVTFSFSDTKAIKNWEIETSQAAPPFDAFYRQWNRDTKR